MINIWQIENNMSPRAYNSMKREAAATETRSRILAAAREILADESGTAELSMDAIARHADVSRLTIYYQFKSRPGLLEALYDQMAARGNLRRIAEVFHEPDVSVALEKLVRIFVAFWSSDPVVIRRLRGMATLDAEMAPGLHARDARRQHIARELLGRIPPSQKIKSKTEELNLAVDVLSMLTSFESYDALAGAGHKDAEIIDTVIKMARVVTGLK
jgi:AcrR family transcriptional regulator